MKIIQPISIPVGFGGADKINTQTKVSGKNSFSDVLSKSVEKVNDLQKQADNAIDDLVLGDNKDIVQTMIAVEKADISFRLMMQIRNKIIQAYEEIMRMQV